MTNSHILFCFTVIVDGDLSGVLEIPLLFHLSSPHMMPIIPPPCDLPLQAHWLVQDDGEMRCNMCVDQHLVKPVLASGKMGDDAARKQRRTVSSEWGMRRGVGLFQGQL